MAQEINKETTEVTQERQVREGRSNTGMIIGTIATVALVAIIIIFFVMSGGSHYKKGNDYLVEKKYTEAVFEFQKVEPSDKDFRRAQSKINYINGLLAYNSGNYNDAAVFLAKVNTDDEYYHDAQLMLEKINGMTLNQNLIDSLRNKKDTVIVKHEISTKEPIKKEPEDPTKKADLELTRKYISESESSINNFEGVYQSSRNAPAADRSDYNKKLSSIQKSFNSIAYQAQNKNGEVLELKNLVSQWMNNRISYIQRLIMDKQPGESEAARSIREAGDRIYSSLRAQLQKVKKI